MKIQSAYLPKHLTLSRVTSLHFFAEDQKKSLETLGKKMKKNTMLQNIISNENNIYLDQQ